ncbi:Similar to Meiotically up-regulated gene 113 protein; acc. no. Q10180 [Pyronema omphalodes CBS 100304]|uniref:Similar to Meiotically up-regulated gene 113 protein acc. no. Q10180 n=1 Tax=Pyronema omphalodes (strain CBS 100304) TaxID=1076935 RepID=U4L1H6_PYROM|nr:Similar to Meiotically up-regulated gene 113 protein; acc. no. Q10180 [Pyronema omphalodes CBS 100304]
MDTLIEKVELLVSGEGSSTPTVKTTVVSTTKKVSRQDDPFKPAPKEDDDEEEESTYSPPKPPSPPPGGFRKDPPRRGFLARLFLSCCCIGGSDPEDEKHWSDKRREAELRQAAAAVVVEENFPHQPGRQKKPDVHVDFNSVPPTPPLPMMFPPKTPTSAIAKPTSWTQPSAVAAGLSPATPGSDDDDYEEINPVDPASLNKEQAKLIKLIPRTIHPRGLGRLQQELLKPFSPKDEPGYIYMFWLNDSPMSPASSPANTPGAQSPGNALLKAALASAPAATPSGSTPKLLFKIGRAVNVQRRLHQWQSQCGYNLSLIRYYPHTSASTPGEVARMVPNVNRVERLIHLELSATPGANPHHKCKSCGKTHKEWFEIEASRDGVLGVDAMIKRWIKFAEDTAGREQPAEGDIPKQTPVRKSPGAKQSSPSPTTSPVGSPSKKDAAGKQPKRPNPPPRKQATQGGIKMYETKPRARSSSRVRNEDSEVETEVETEPDTDEENRRKKAGGVSLKVPNSRGRASSTGANSLKPPGSRGRGRSPSVGARGKSPATPSKRGRKKRDSDDSDEEWAERDYEPEIEED